MLWILILKGLTLVMCTHNVFSSRNKNFLASMAQLDVRQTGDQEVAGSILAGPLTFFLWRFDHEIFSMIILSH